MQHCALNNVYYLLALAANEIRMDVQSVDFGTLRFSKVCMANIRTDAQSLDFGTLGFSKVCKAKIRADVQSLDFGNFEL